MCTDADALSEPCRCEVCFPEKKLTACFFVGIIFAFLELFIINLDFKTPCMLERSLPSRLSIHTPTSQYEAIVVLEGCAVRTVEFVVAEENKGNKEMLLISKFHATEHSLKS
jgi:hypothetical protein